MPKEKEVHHYEYLTNDKQETKSRFVFFTNKLKTTEFGVLMHGFAVLSLVYGFLNTTLLDTPTAVQQTVQALWQIKYVAYAIFFELVALNCKKIE